MVRYCLLCKWSTDTNIKGKRSLHRFPTDEAQKNNWLKIIGKTDAKLSKHSRLCSSHFEDSCFRNTASCFKTLKPNSMPTKYLTERPPDDEEDDYSPVKKTKFLSIQWNSLESQPLCKIENIAVDELQSPASIQVCRICLASDVKMCHIGECDLYEYYENITGIELSFDDTLPKMLCWECVARLKTAHSFREKALRSYYLLLSKVKADTYMTLRDVQSIDRVGNNLQSQLVVEHFDPEDLSTSTDIPECLPEEDDIVEMGCQYDDNNDNIENIPEVVLEFQNGDLLKDECQDHSKDDVGEQSDDHIDTIKSKRNGRPTTWSTFDSSKFTIRRLSVAEQLEELERRRESPAYRAARYRCTVCYRVFVTQAKQDKHSIKHSDSRGKFECDICKTRLRSLRMLRYHIASCHTTSFACKVCPFRTKTRFVAKKHLLFHAGMTFKCPHCPLEFERQTQYFNHIRKQHVSKFVCEYCGETFVSQKGTDSHKKRSHTPTDFEAELAGPYCAECDVRFATDEAHDRHLQQSAAHRLTDSVLSKRRRRRRKCVYRHTSEAVRCEQCGAGCDNFRAYAQHFRQYHPGFNRTQYCGADPAMCEQCGKIFQNKALLRYHHMAIHTGSKFDCPECDKRFTSCSNVQRHIRQAHGGEKRFKCETCDKRFGQRNTLQSHIDHVHLNVPWPKRVRAPRPRPASSASYPSDAIAETVEI